MYTQRGRTTLVCGGTERYKILSPSVLNAISRIAYSPSNCNTELELSMIHTDASSAAELVNLLNNRPQFTKFCFSFNKAMTKKCAVVQKVVADAAHVTALELAYSKIPMRIGCELVSRLMLPKCAITTLVLRHTELGTITAGRLANYIKATTTMTSFTFISATEGAIKTFRILQKAIEENTSIEHLEVFRVHITNRQMLRLLTSLFQKPHLTHLVLGSNDITTEDTRIRYTIKIPQFHPALKKLEFSNPLSPNCFESLLKRLESNKTLTHVNLAGCELGTIRVEEVLGAFHNNPTIENIDVSMNNASPDALSLALLLRSAPALKKLHSFIPKTVINYTADSDMLIETTHNHSNIILLGEDSYYLPGCSQWIHRNLSNKKNKKWTLFRVMATRVKEYNLLL